jgi:hypothetical protein
MAFEKVVRGWGPPALSDLSQVWPVGGGAHPELFVHDEAKVRVGLIIE